MYVAGEVRPVLSRVKIHPRHSRGGVGLSDGVRGGRGPQVLTGRRGLSGGRKPQHCLGDGERRMARAPPPHRPRSGETLLTCPPRPGLCDGTCRAWGATPCPHRRRRSRSSGTGAGCRRNTPALLRIPEDLQRGPRLELDKG